MNAPEYWVTRSSRVMTTVGGAAQRHRNCGKMLRSRAAIA
jgi:hypothetical protein